MATHVIAYRFKKTYAHDACTPAEYKDERDMRAIPVDDAAQLFCILCRQPLMRDMRPVDAGALADARDGLDDLDEILDEND